MIKKHLIAALEEFEDDDHIVFDEYAMPYVPKIHKVCGKRMQYMVYFCVLEPNHTGDCYCGCKNVYFKPD